MNLKFKIILKNKKANKKGGVSLSVGLIVILTILLFATTLVLFVSREKNFENNIYSTSALSDLYSREKLLNFQIQNMVDKAFQGVESEEDFLVNFQAQLNTYKNSEGAFFNADLEQIESQLSAEKVNIEKENGLITKISITFNIEIDRDFVVKDKKIFTGDYKYIKTFESKY